MLLLHISYFFANTSYSNFYFRTEDYSFEHFYNSFHKVIFSLSSVICSHVTWDFCTISYANMNYILNILNVLTKSCAIFKYMVNVDIILLSSTWFGQLLAINSNPPSVGSSSHVSFIFKSYAKPFRFALSVHHVEKSLGLEWISIGQFHPQSPCHVNKDQIHSYADCSKPMLCYALSTQVSWDPWGFQVKVGQQLLLLEGDHSLT